MMIQSTTVTSARQDDESARHPLGDMDRAYELVRARRRRGERGRGGRASARERHVVGGEAGHREVVRGAGALVHERDLHRPLMNGDRGRVEPEAVANGEGDLLDAVAEPGCPSRFGEAFRFVHPARLTNASAASRVAALRVVIGWQATAAASKMIKGAPARSSRPI